MTEGKKRKLIIKDCKIDDTAGITIKVFFVVAFFCKILFNIHVIKITIKVPGDESSAPLKVARKSPNILIVISRKS